MPGRYPTRYKLPVTSFQQTVTHTDVSETTRHCNSAHRSRSDDYRHIVAAPYTLRLVINREQGRLTSLIFPFELRNT